MNLSRVFALSIVFLFDLLLIGIVIKCIFINHDLTMVFIATFDATFFLILTFVLLGDKT
jgi:hypothetical protein